MYYLYNGEGERVAKLNPVDEANLNGGTPDTCAAIWTPIGGPVLPVNPILSNTQALTPTTTATGSATWTAVSGGPVSPVNPVGTLLDAKLYWGQGLAESDVCGNITKEYVYLAGKRIALQDYTDQTGGVYYYFADHLGSSSVVTDDEGNVIDESLFYPFGQELPIQSGSGQDYKFTGKELDPESGLDYFGARYYASNMGRWMSPDWADKPEAVPYSSLDDPQTLNLYQYVRNNPLSTPDIDGHGWWSDFGNGLANSTYRPLGQAIAHPINTVEGIGHALAHPIATAEAIGSGIKSTAVSVTQGDGLAIGTAVGTVGMALVPGVGEAGEGAEAAADLSKVSEAGQATSKVDQIVNTIDQGGFNVTQNAKTAGQEANVTITHPNEPGVNLNLRSESHPLPGSGGQPVPHVNVEKVTPRTGSTPKQVDNTHITQ